MSVDAFLEAALVPLDAGHATGALDEADRILAEDPSLVTASIHAAATLGDAEAVGRFLDDDPGLAGAPGGSRGWDPLTHLAFSRYLRLDPSRSDGFVRAATRLLEAGADPNAGWWNADHGPEPEFESVLYGAAGVAHHAALTRLLVDRGADPDDEEVVYHAPESYENEALRIVVGTGRIGPDGLARMLVRKADWHDTAGAVWLMEQGADPDRPTRWGFTALQQAVRRDNELAVIERMLDHGADPGRPAGLPEGVRPGGRPDPDWGHSAAALAARRGRGDVLEALERREVLPELSGLDALLAAAARGRADEARRLLDSEPPLADELERTRGRVLSAFAGGGNAEGVRCLLELGIPVGAVDVHGDGYFGIAPGSTALHAAAWRMRPGVVRVLLEAGAPRDARDVRGRTPLRLAVQAGVDSHWTARRSADVVRMLLDAGASSHGIDRPTGWDEVDALLGRAPGPA